MAVLAIGGLAVRNAQLTAERDAQIAQSQNLENLLDRFGRPGVEHALLAREDGTTVAAVVVENGRPEVFPIEMPANAADRETYVLWGVAEGANPAPLGTFDVTGNDEGLLAIGGLGAGVGGLRRLRDLARTRAGSAGGADAGGGVGTGGGVSGGVL